MLTRIYSLGFNYPKIVIAAFAVITTLFAMQLDGLRWETDARVYLPKGHEAIIYDEKVDDIFGVKDTLIISIVNEKEGIYNSETLARIARIAKQVVELPGVLASTDIDIASIATSTVFEGDDTSMGSYPIMDKIPQTEAEIDALKQKIEEHKDILVGNLVSEDGTAAMIRIKIKEGQQHRYMTYFQVKSLISKELGEEPDWGPWGANDTDSDGKWAGNEWADADGQPKAIASNIETDTADTDKDFAGNKWVKTDGMPKTTAIQEEKEEADWGGNQWVNADGSAKREVGEADENFGGNKWVKTDGSPKPVAEQVEKEEADWGGNQWVNSDGTAKRETNQTDENFGGNKWVDAGGAPKNAASQEQKSESDWEGNQWLNLDGSQRKDLLANVLPTEGGDWAASEFAVGVSANEKHHVVTLDIPQADPNKPMNDVFYLAGRPVIEVSSGLFAMEDMALMVPLLIGVMALALLIIFRTWRGMLLPIIVMSTAIIWTFGLMVVTDVPLYTISTMLPVILVAVGVGDGVHLLSAYYDRVLKNPQDSAYNIVKSSTLELGPPLIMTSVTTAIGFLALLFAEMPPFKVFGIFALIGILFSWFISITLLPAILSLLKPKVGNYLAKKRSIRVHEEKNRLALFLTRSGRWIEAHRNQAVVALAVLILVSVVGTSRLFVDSSWMSDFNEETDIAKATKVLNEKFSGSIFLNVVVEAKENDAFKNPELLTKMEGLQSYVKTLPYVGDSISVVDYIKSMNKALHSGDEAFNVIPDSAAQIGEYLFLFSVSGRPQQLDEVVDYDYKTGLITVMIQTDHTRDLKHIMDSVQAYVDREFNSLNVDVNFAGSGNNSFIWAKLLIDSQTHAIVLSKIAIFIVAALVFASLIAGFYVVIPVTLSTLFVAGFAGIFSIPLDVSTALAAGIAIGVGVDYAVHYLFRYIRERKQGRNHGEATAQTLRTTGHTIVLNATVVTVGFSVLFFSNFPPHSKLGIFVTAYMIMSCLVAIWILPALISYFKPAFIEPKKT